MAPGDPLAETPDTTHPQHTVDEELAFYLAHDQRYPFVDTTSLVRVAQFISYAREKDPGLAKRYYLTFDDIFKLPEGPLREVLSVVELDDLARAVKGIAEETVEQAIQVLPAKKQAMYEPVEEALSKREINEARRKIMGEVRRLQEQGQINIMDILAGEMVE